MTKEKVCAYCRVSTRSDDQENSFENQKSYFEREINENENYQLYNIYADRGISGTKLSRPQFDRMLIDAGLDIENGYKVIAEPKFNLIMVKNTSRFARNVSVDVILKALAKNKVYVYFLDLNKTTKNSDDITYIQIFQSFDERESRDKSKKTMFGMREGAKKGIILCNNKIYGYDYNPKPINTLVLNDKEAKVVKAMFEMYLEGFGVRRISQRLADNGIFNRSGGKFGDTSIRHILTNEKYYGVATRMKYSTGTVFEKHSPQIRDKAEQIIFETNKIPAIVTKDQFDKVQEILHSKVQHQKQIGINHGTSDYAQKVICGNCGSLYWSSITRQYKTRTERHYACKQKRQTIQNEQGEWIKLCNNPNVSQTQLDKAISNEEYSFLLFDNMLGASLFLEQIQSILKLQMESQDISEVEKLKAELDIIEDNIGKLLDLFTAGKISEKLINKKAEPLQNKAYELSEKITALTKPIADLQMDIDEIENTIAVLKQRCQLTYDIEQDKAINDYTRQEILKDVKYIIVDEYGNLTLIFKSFDDIRLLIEKHKYVLPNELKADFENLATLGLYDELIQKYANLNNDTTEITKTTKELLQQILKESNFKGTIQYNNEIITKTQDL